MEDVAVEDKHAASAQWTGGLNGVVPNLGVVTRPVDGNEIERLFGDLA